MKKIFYLLFISLFSCGSATKQIIYNDDFRQAESEKINPHVFKIKEKFGVENQLGIEILKPIYSDIKIINKQFIQVAIKDKIGVFDYLGKQIIELGDFSEIEYYQTIVNKNKSFFIISDLKGKKAIYNLVGKQLYPFEIDKFDSDFTYQNHTYFAISKTKEVPYEYNGNNYKSSAETKLIKVLTDSVQVLLQQKTQINKYKKNLVSFYCIDKTIKTGVLDLNTNKSISFDGATFYYNNFTNEIWAKTGDFYDKIIDTNLVVSKNKFENIAKIENDNCFLETSNGMQIMSLAGKKALFNYPKIESYNAETDQYSFIYGQKYSDYQRKLFKFYVNKESKKYGVIDINGAIIVEAEKYDNIEYVDLNNVNATYKNMPDYKLNYLKDNKLSKLFYGCINAKNDKGLIKIIREDGSELITIPLENEKGCYIDLTQFSMHNHLMAKCTDKMKIYDLNSKKMVFEMNESNEGYNFTERYSNGYYFTEFNSPKKTTIKYLSNKLKLLYVQVVQRDSLWHKLIKGDKIYFNKNNKIGLIDFNENELVAAQYDKIDIVHENFNVVTNDKKVGVILNNNKIVINLMYDKVIYNVSNQSFDCYINDKKDVYYLNRLQID